MEADDWALALIEFATKAEVKTIVTSYVPVGPVADRLSAARPLLAAAGIQFLEIRRLYDEATWPHAMKSFFKLRDKIPKLIEHLGA